jgi:predicted Zn-dependent peptidase
VEFHKHVLGNGLEIVAECNDAAHSMALGFFVDAGSRDETDEVAGVSHFLEHMMFKGTPTRSADDVNREFDEMGTHYNAFTNEENTVYYAAALPEQQSPLVELLSDMMRPSLREEDFDTEKKVIIEEIRMYEDQPPFCADDKARAVYFGSHPLGRSVLGTEETIGQLAVGQMREYFARRYSPGNISLVAAGRVDFDALVADVERHCGHWESAQSSRTIEAAVTNRRFMAIEKDIATQQYALQLCPGPAAADNERHAAKLLANILGDDSGSRLYWELVDPGLAEHAALGHHEYAGSGVMLTYMCCDPQQAADNLQTILAIYRQAEAKGITLKELETAKCKMRSRLVLSSERPRGRLFMVGSNWIYRREYLSIDEDIELLSAVSKHQIGAVLESYPLSENTTVTIGPSLDVPAPK